MPVPSSSRWKPTFSIISPQGDGNEKPLQTSTRYCSYTMLFQSFPRKGMETQRRQPSLLLDWHFFNHFPARGWKPLSSLLLAVFWPFFNHFPARGWKQKPYAAAQHICGCDTFSIISPQGDGNLRHRPRWRQCLLLFQSFPRKGMETSTFCCSWRVTSYVFFNHFPARGWKQRTDW